MKTLRCRQEFATLGTVECSEVIDALVTTRMSRKSGRVLEVWEECLRDWNETLYRMAAYAMGAPRHSAPFERLTRKVSYLMCLKERSSRFRVEVLLLGASGLLKSEYFDDGLDLMLNEFGYLGNKYRVEPMQHKDWSVGFGYPAAHPAVRIVQLAGMVAKDEFGVDGVLGLATIEDVERVLGVTMSDYWCRRLLPGGVEVGHIGRDKINMLAINLVVPFQMAYARTTNDRELWNRALNLLEQVPAEHNRLVGRWTGEGVACRTAVESQALIEISHMCDDGKCADCPLERVLHRA